MRKVDIYAVLERKIVDGIRITDERRKEDSHYHLTSTTTIK